jgi:hypothetical protein
VYALILSILVFYPEQSRGTALCFQRNCKQESGMCTGRHWPVFLKFLFVAFRARLFRCSYVVLF